MRSREPAHWYIAPAPSPHSGYYRVTIYEREDAWTFEVAREWVSTCEGFRKSATPTLDDVLLRLPSYLIMGNYGDGYPTRAAAAPPDCTGLSFYIRSVTVLGLGE